MANTRTSIPSVYRIVFTVVDPLFCLFGAVQHLVPALQDETLRGYSPKAPLPPATGTLHLLETLAAFFVALGVLEAVLLRARASDVTVWKTVQGSIALLDLIMVYAAVNALNAEGRLQNSRAWRSDDWRLVVGNAGMGLIRTCCALGVAMPDIVIDEAEIKSSDKRKKG